MISFKLLYSEKYNNMNVEVQMLIFNEFGEFFGKKTIVSKEDYIEICKISKLFYINGGFELSCENGDYIIFGPEIVKKSILKIKKKEIDV